MAIIASNFKENKSFLLNLAIVVLFVLRTIRFVSYHRHGDSKLCKITMMFALTSNHVTLNSCDW